MLITGPRTNRAKKCLDAIVYRKVACVAPEILMAEFVKVAFDCRSGRRPLGRQPDDIEDQLELFLRLPIVYIPSAELVRSAWDHICHHQISPPDSWYLAAAADKTRPSELWISHEHSDGFTAQARSVYPYVFTLEKHNFDRPN
jgi:hypothetical protein